LKNLLRSIPQDDLRRSAGFDPSEMHVIDAEPRKRRSLVAALEQFDRRIATRQRKPVRDSGRILGPHGKESGPPVMLAEISATVKY
jgi:hypothetical protein